MSRKGRRRTEGLMFNETGSISAEMIVEAREENGIWPIRFEPPPNGEKGWAHFAVSLLGLDTEMTPAEQAVLAVLIDHANPKTGQCNPSVARIAKGVKRHRRTVFRALAGLQAKGLTDNLAKNHNGARRRVGNAYQVRWVKLRETLDAYEQRIAKGKRLAGLSSDSMMSPPSDAIVSPPLVTPDVTLNLKREPKTEPNTPKAAHFVRSADLKSSDTETRQQFADALERLKASRKEH